MFRKLPTKTQIIYFLLGSTLFSFSICAAHAQDLQSRTADAGSVVLEGKKLFAIRTKLGPYGPAARAENIQKKLERLVQDPDFKIASIAAVDSEGETDVLAGDVVITAVTDADAKVVGITRADLAEIYVNKLKSELPPIKAKRSIQGALEDASMENFGHSLLQLLFEPMTLKFMISFIGAGMILVLVTLVKKSVGKYVQDSSKRYASKKIITFAGYFLGLVFITVVYKDTLGNLAVIVGAATAGIAFALKEVIVSIAGWVAVTFGDFYKVGDRIQLGGIKGDVIDIGFGRTTLMELGEWVKGDLYTGRIVRVSNSFVFSEPFFNYSGDFPFLWDESTIPIKYGSDYKLARQILEKVAQEVSADVVDEAERYWRIIEKKYLVEDARTSPMVTLVLNDNWMEFTIRYVVNYRRRRLAKDLLYTRILEEVDKTNGKVGFASATFQLVEAPVFEVNLTSQAER